MIKHGMAAAYDAKLTLIFTAILAGGCAAYQRFGAATGGGGAGVAMGGCGGGGCR